MVVSYILASAMIQRRGVQFFFEGILLPDMCGKSFKFISDDDLCVMNHRPLPGAHMYVDSVHEVD
jgi:hypothetical protein